MTAGRAVAIGGGTGQPRVLGALLGLGMEPTAIVTMADDGGSSGRLREELGASPPGDARNCLVALAEEALLAEAFQYRFGEGTSLAPHALGNLVIAVLERTLGSFPAALDSAGRCLGIRGRVLPSSESDMRLVGVTREGVKVSGQAAIARSPVAIERVCLQTKESPRAYGPALEAIAQASLVVIGPGSLFTSILPNFLADGMSDALRESPACRVYVCNVANQRGETGGMDAAEHVEALLAHGLDGAIDVVLVHEGSPGDLPKEARLDGGPEPRRRIEKLGISVWAGDLADPADRRRHHVAALQTALGEVSSCRSQQK